MNNWKGRIENGQQEVANQKQRMEYGQWEMDQA